MLVRVRHLNVVMVHGADVHGGRMGFWMDFVEGVDAGRRHPPRGSAQRQRGLAWGQDLCRALAAVHGAGIVHRDVKAQNVMRRTSDGRLVLMDFGAGELLGTPAGGRGGRDADCIWRRSCCTAPRRPAAPTSTRWACCCSSSCRASSRCRRPTWDELIAAHARHGARAAGRRAARHACRIRGRDRARAQARPVAAICQRRRDAGRHARRRRLRAAELQDSPSRCRLVQPAGAALSDCAATVMQRGVSRRRACSASPSCSATWRAWLSTAILAVDPVFAAGFSDISTVGRRRRAAVPAVSGWRRQRCRCCVRRRAPGAVATWRGRSDPPRGPLLARIRSRGPRAPRSALAGALGCSPSTMWFYPVFAALDELRYRHHRAENRQALAPGGIEHDAREAVGHSQLRARLRRVEGGFRPSSDVRRLPPRCGRFVGPPSVSPCWWW